jgi:hypothetical protein
MARVFVSWPALRNARFPPLRRARRGAPFHGATPLPFRMPRSRARARKPGILENEKDKDREEVARLLALR